MLFDERKNPYHLMLRDLVNAGGLDAFFKTFDTMIVESEANIKDESSETGPVSEFLDSWLPLLEKLVNPKMILETPHSMAPKSHTAINYTPFNVNQYLITVHNRAYLKMKHLWFTRSKKILSEQTSEHMLSILCHILKGEIIINENIKKERESEQQSTTTISNRPGSISSSAQTLDRPEYSGYNDVQFQQLVDMGFARDAVIDALNQCQTTELATEFLLTTPQVSSNWSASANAGPSEPQPTGNQDVDMVAENDSSNDNKATADDKDIHDKKSDTTKVDLTETPTPKNQQREEPMSKAVIDDFTEGSKILPRALELLDEIPTTVYKVCDLILTVAQRNGDAWCATLLEILLDDIINNVNKLLERAEPLRVKDKKSFAEWTCSLRNADEAYRVAVRIHLYSLLFDEMKIQCASYLYNKNAIDPLIRLLEIGLDLFSLSRDSCHDDPALSSYRTPRWLAPTILLLDLYEKGAVASQRRAPLINNMQRTWLYFEERSGRWTPHTPVNNKIIDDAYKNGEQFVRYSAGRKHYQAQFSFMLQVNEDTRNLKPIMMTLTPSTEKTDEKDLVPLVPRLREHQTKILIRVCVALMQLPIDSNSSQAVMRLSFRLTRNYDLAVMFAEMGGIRALQNLVETSQFNGFVSLATLIIRHVIEEPTVLHQTMEKVIRSTAQHCHQNHKEMHYLLRALSSAACRNEDIFKKLTTEIFRIMRPASSRRDEDDPRTRSDAPQLIKLLPPKPSVETIKPSPVTRCLIADLLDSLTIPIQTRAYDMTNGQSRFASSPKSSPTVPDSNRGQIPQDANVSRMIYFTMPNPNNGQDMSKQPGISDQNPISMKHHNPIMNHSIILRLLAELTRSYSVVPKIIADHVYTSSTNESISEDISALAFILDNILPATQTHSDREGPPLARVFLAALAACNHCVEAQIALVNEVKSSLNRAASMPESCEKHARLQSLAIMIGTMIDCCPPVAPPQSGSRQNGNMQQRQSNNIVRLFVRKGLVTDLARIPNSLDLSAPHMFATMNSIMKPLETMSRCVNLHSQSSQNRHQPPPPKKPCSSSSSSSEIHDQSATPTLNMDSTTTAPTSNNSQQDNNTVQPMQATPSATDDSSMRQDQVHFDVFSDDHHVVVRPIGGNDLASESRDNVVNSNGAESESGEEEERSEDEDDEEEEENGEVSGVDEREDDADDEDDDEEEEDEDEDHVDDDEDHVDEDDAEDDEILNHANDNQFAEDYRIYNGNISSVLENIEEVFFNQPNVLYNDRLSNIVPGVYNGSMDQLENSGPSLPPPPGSVSLTHPLLLRRLDIPNHPNLQPPSGPAAMTNRAHRYARPRMLPRGPPGTGPSQWHTTSGGRQPQTILQQLLGPSAVQEVITLTNQIVGPNRLLVTDFNHWLTNEADGFEDVSDAHTLSTTQATALSTIPLVMTRWTEGSKILDGASLHDCIANIKQEIVPILEAFEEQEESERQEKRKKTIETDEQAQQKKSKEPSPSSVAGFGASTSASVPLESTGPATISNIDPKEPTQAPTNPVPVSMPQVSPASTPTPTTVAPTPMIIPTTPSAFGPVSNREPTSSELSALVTEPATPISLPTSILPSLTADNSESQLESSHSSSMIEATIETSEQRQPQSSTQAPPPPPTSSETQSSNTEQYMIPDGVDPSFLAALPEDIRQEVLAEQWRLVRNETANAARQSAAGTATSRAPASADQPSVSSGPAFPEVNAEFLDALPDEVREEVLAQQRAEQQRQAAVNANPDQPVDPANFIQTLGPNLRRQVLSDMDDSLLSLLPSELLAEAQAYRRELLNSNTSTNSTLSRLLRTAAAGRVQRARYTITSVQDHLHAHRSWYWPFSREGSMPHGGSANRNLLALTRDPKFKGRQLLDGEALSCLLILLFVNESRLNIDRLHRVIRNLSYHPPTRRWLVQSMLGIIDRAQSHQSLNNSLDSNNMLPTTLSTTKRSPSASSQTVVPMNSDDNQDSANELKLNYNSSWMSISMDAALGCRASVFSVRKNSFSSHQPASFAPYNGKCITVHNQAAMFVCRHILEALIALAKSFPQQFFPEQLQTSDDSNQNDSDSTLIGSDFWDVLARLEATSISGSGYSKKGKNVNKQLQIQSAAGSNNSNNSASQQPPIIGGSRKVEDDSAIEQPLSPLARVMGFLAHPIIKRSFILTDRLLHLLSVISNAFPVPFDHICEPWTHQSHSRSSNYARRGHLAGYMSRHMHSHRPILHHNNMAIRSPPTTRAHFHPHPEPAMQDANPAADNDKNINKSLQKSTDDKKSNDPSKPTQPLVSKPYIKLAVDVLTSKSCSEEGLDDVTSLLARLSKACPATKAIVLELLMEGGRELGLTVCNHISILKQELKDFNSGHGTRKSIAGSSKNTSISSNVQSTSDGSPSSSGKGVVQDRFTNDSVIITAPSTAIKPGSAREVQLPSMALLTSKNSSQSFFLRILKVIIQLRDSAAAIASAQQPQHGAAGRSSVARQQTAPTLSTAIPSTSAQAQQSSSTTLNADQQPAGTSTSTTSEGKQEEQQDNKSSAMDVDPAVPSSTGESSSELSIQIDVDHQQQQLTDKLAKKEDDSLSVELQLDDLWNTLSECLLELAETPDHHAVLVLQPAVEAFFLVHSPGSSSRKSRNGTSDDHADKNSQTAHINQEVAPISPGDSTNQTDHAGLATCLSHDTQRFVKFAETHRIVLNHILRQSGVPLSQGPFAVLVDHTRVLDFDVKRRYFRQELERLDDGIRRDDLGIHVRRDNVFEESFRELHRRSSEEWKNRFFVVFEDEEGQDAGGLLREWYTIISREIFNPNYALFTTSPGDRVTYMINSASHCNSNHLSYFKFVGRVIAKAIYDNKLLDCYFTRSFYKHILGKPVKYTDMESEDYSFYQGLVFLLEHDVSELGYELTFSVEVREFGVTDVRELKPDGSNIPVTEENKHEYVRLVCQEKMTGSIRKQLNAFLEGFYNIIPKRLISIFNEQELELLISGLPNIDIDDLKASTEYHKYLPNSLQIQWFWRALRSFNQADRAKLLQFVTGTSKVPLQGFASLEGMNGVQKFQIHRDERSTDRLPSAHTCFNQLDLPVYETYDKLRHMLLKAIQECSEGFGLA